MQAATRPGAYEKVGNTVWVRCPACASWFPVSPLMLDGIAPPCICPACHADFRPGTAAGPA